MITAQTAGGSSFLPGFAPERSASSNG
jgi:hypothetical protein